MGQNAPMHPDKSPRIVAIRPLRQAPRQLSWGDGTEDDMTVMHDMHCHLGFMENAEEVAADALAAGTRLFANTVTPVEWARMGKLFAGSGNVTVGFGMHPWWIAGDQDDNGARIAERPRGTSQRAFRKEMRQRSETPMKRGAGAIGPEAEAQRREILELLEEHDPAILGEVGLDFGWSHFTTRESQLAIFEAIATWAAKRDGKLLSLHAVKSAPECVDVLERSGALESCTCIFHWFTGPSDLLKHVIKAGCFFSCGPRMLETGKGREYVKAIPVQQLLLETDAPPEQGTPYSYDELRAELEGAANAIAAIKGAGALDVIARTSERLLG